MQYKIKTEGAWFEIGSILRNQHTNRQTKVLGKFDKMCVLGKQQNEGMKYTLMQTGEG